MATEINRTMLQKGECCPGDRTGTVHSLLTFSAAQNDSDTAVKLLFKTIPANSSNKGICEKETECLEGLENGLNTVGVKLSQEGPETGNSGHKNQRTLSSGTAVRMTEAPPIFCPGLSVQTPGGRICAQQISTSQCFPAYLSVRLQSCDQFWPMDCERSDVGGTSKMKLAYRLHRSLALEATVEACFRTPEPCPSLCH